MSEKQFIFDGGSGHWRYPDGRTEPFVVGRIPVEDVLKRGETVAEQEPDTDSPAVVYWNDLRPEDQVTMAEMLGLPAEAAQDGVFMRDALAHKAAEWETHLSPEQCLSLAPDAVDNNPYKNVRFEDRPA